MRACERQRDCKGETDKASVVVRLVFVLLFLLLLVFHKSRHNCYLKIFKMLHYLKNV